MITEINLGDLYLNKGGSLDPSKFPNETFEYYSIPAYDSGKPEIVEGKVIGSSKKVFQPNDIILSRIIPHIRRCWIVGSNIGIRQIGSGEWITFRSNKIEPSYLRHYLMSNEFNLKFLKTIKGVGGSLMRADPNQVSKFKFLLPPLHQQQKIANILDAADTLRQNEKILIGKYDELKQALFLDMFGDPVSNPKKWEVHKLKEISTKIHSGNTPKGGSEVYVKAGITFFRSQNVWKNRLVYEDIAFIDYATHDKMMKSSLKHKDILMTKTGRINTENSSLGRAAMYLGEDDKANVNGHVYLIRLKKNIINEFVLHILTTKEYRGHIRSVCVGGIDKRQLNKDHLENFPIINPPIELQNAFAERLKLIEEQKSIVQKSLEKSEELFNSLLQKAFKGELE
jgi:type I restriction enzyme, S subunit